MLNKRVEITIQARDDKGKLIPNKYTQATGICTFVGENKWLNWPLQVTINRTPFQIRSLKDIKVL